MQNKKDLPKIKIRRTTLDWVIEFIGLFFLIILIALPFIFSGKLPDRIPTHFNIAGEPDGYGSKMTLWILPLTAAIMYIGMTILEAFPYIYNYPVEITPENAVSQYKLGTRLIRILKTTIAILFSFLSYQTMKTALGSAAGLGKVFLPVFLMITFGIIIIYLVRSLNSKHGDQSF
jgi:uncharacterized membrane protein